MYDIGSDFDYITGQKLTSKLSLFLIEAASGGADEQLSTGMAVLIVAATGFERYVRHRYVQYLILRQRSQIGLTDKIL